MKKLIGNSVKTKAAKPRNVVAKMGIKPSLGLGQHLDYVSIWINLA